MRDDPSSRPRTGTLLARSFHRSGRHAADSIVVDEYRAARQHDEGWGEGNREGAVGTDRQRRRTVVGSRVVSRHVNFGDIHGRGTPVGKWVGTRGSPAGNPSGSHYGITGK